MFGISDKRVLAVAAAPFLLLGAVMLSNFGDGRMSADEIKKSHAWMDSQIVPAVEATEVTPLPAVEIVSFRNPTKVDYNMWRRPEYKLTYPARIVDFDDAKGKVIVILATMLDCYSATGASCASTPQSAIAMRERAAMVRDRLAKWGVSDGYEIWLMRMDRYGFRTWRDKQLSAPLVNHRDWLCRDRSKGANNDCFDRYIYAPSVGNGSEGENQAMQWLMESHYRAGGMGHFVSSSEPFVSLIIDKEGRLRATGMQFSMPRTIAYAVKRLSIAADEQVEIQHVRMSRKHQLELVGWREQRGRAWHRDRFEFAAGVVNKLARTMPSTSELEAAGFDVPEGTITPAMAKALNDVRSETKQYAMDDKRVAELKRQFPNATVVNSTQEGALTEAAGQ